MFETKFYTVCCRAMKVIRSISAVLLGALLLVVVFQIFARSIFNLPTPWTEEVCTILITYNTFIGGIVVMMRGEHIAIDLVSEHVSPKTRNIFQVIYLIVYIGVCTYLTYFGTKLCLSPTIYKQFAMATHFPRVAIYGIMPIGMCIAGIYCVIHLFFVVRHIINKETIMTVHNVDQYTRYDYE